MSELLERARREGTPLIEGEQVTFVWQGEPAPFLHLETQDWEPLSLTQTEPGVWTYQTTIRRDAYVEYNYATEPSVDAIVPDPFNKRRVDTGLGHDNQYFDMPDTVHTPLIAPQPGIAQGTIRKHTIASKFMLAGYQRDVWLYQPPVEQPVPLLLVYDGKDYLERGKINIIVDNLIAQGAIPPLAMLLIDNAGDARYTEYNQGEALLLLINHLLLPLAHEHLTLVKPDEQPGAYGVLGASMGGLMALYTGLRMPGIFGHVVSQSGAFFPGEPHLPHLMELWVQHMPQANLIIWQDVGLYEYLHEHNVRMNSVLRDAGYDVTYHEYPGGHNYTCWRDQVPRALTTVFGSSQP